MRGKEQETLTYLQGIAKTLSLSIDGDMLDSLMKTYPEKDMVKTSDQDDLYRELHEQIKEAKELNNVSSPIYTLTYISEKKRFEFGVTSSEVPYYRHGYTDFPNVLLDNYSKGGVIPKYEDENGSWMSAFFPIYSSEKEVVAVLQVDKLFVDFEEEARSLLTNQLLISLGIMLVMGIAMYPLIRLILKREQDLVNTLEEKVIKRTSELESQKNELDALMTEQKSSILYAKKIQDNIFSHAVQIKKSFPESMIVIQAKDVINGDFVWYHRYKEIHILVTGESTSHGIPGAFITLIVNSLLERIVITNKITRPDEILNQLHIGIVRTLNQRNSTNKEMIHASVCVFNNSDLLFAGANASILLVQQGNCKTIKGNKMPVGGFNFDLSKKFESQSFKMGKGTRIYSYTDGLNDQLYGDDNTADNVEQLIAQNLATPITQMEQEQRQDLKRLKGSQAQLDDILLVGLEIE